MTTKALMLQGTGSDVGKSVLVAALCRIAFRKGIRVAPFKPQNMSNNAHACADGGEIGRAQATQAWAAGIEPHIDLNPILLKPESDRTAQVIVHGRASTRSDAYQYITNRDRLLPSVMESFNRLAANYDLILIEGAGSPAETNLRDRDIANMGFAQAAGVPVCLIGDIDRGGVIAAIVGTKTVIDPQDAGYIQAFLINKFRGDPDLFSEGIAHIEHHTQWPCLGVVPWLNTTSLLPAEDAVVLDQPREASSGTTKIVAPMLPRIANFDDVDPLRLEPAVDFEFIPPGRPIPRDADIVILLGTKSTIADLHFLRDQGWHHDIYAHVRSGGRVLGLCGGYQMLGTEIADPQGIDGNPGATKGLGLLDITTEMSPEKSVKPVSAHCMATRLSVSAYEIHSGRTSGTDTNRAMFELPNGNDGAQNLTGRVQGCYLHGLFTNDAYRTHWLGLDDHSPNNAMHYHRLINNAMDQLADEVASHCDIDAILAQARPIGWHPDQVQ